MADEDLWDPRTRHLSAEERHRLRRTGGLLALLFFMPLSLDPTFFAWEVLALGFSEATPSQIASVMFAVHLLVMPSLLGFVGAALLVNLARRRAGMWLLGTWMASSLIVLALFVLTWVASSPGQADFEAVAISFLFIVGLLCGPMLQGAALVVRSDGWSSTAGRIGGWSAVLLGGCMLLDLMPGSGSLRLVTFIATAFEMGDALWLIGAWLTGVLLYILLGMAMFAARPGVLLASILVTLGRILFGIGLALFGYYSFVLVAGFGGEIGWTWILGMVRTFVAGVLTFALVGQGLRLWIGRGGPGGRVDAHHIEAF